MSKKLILVFVGVVFFSRFNLARADVILDEIAWKGTVAGSTHEWLELENTGALTDISGWTIKDGENQLNIILPSGTTFQSGGFYVIKRTTSDITPYDFSTAFAGGLSDAGEKLILSDSAGVIKETLDFSGGWPDPAMASSQTMQWNGSAWVSENPTPGYGTLPSTTSNATTSDASSVVVGGSGLPANDSNNNDLSSIASTTNNQTEVQNIKTQIVGKTLGFVGLPVSLNATTFGPSGEKIFFGKYFWNFGDGDSKEISLTDSQPFTHTFYYPGNYVVSLNYYQNYYGNDLVPDATSQTNIKIIPADISISKVGDTKDFFVELTNNTDYNADISGWVLSSAQKSFSFPKNTIIISKQKMMISPKITNFSINDKNTLKLMDSGGNTIFDYTNPIVPVALATHKTTATTIVAEDIPDINNLIATALPNNIQDSSNLNDPTTFYSPKEIIIFVAAFVFVGLSAYLIYFVRQKKVLPKSAADDFEILDE